ncbi:MAG: hypothetical protein WBF36_13290, partial [Desulfobulbales bacterium]
MDFQNSISHTNFVPKVLKRLTLDPSVKGKLIGDRFREAPKVLKWQDELNNNVTTLEELKEYIDLGAAEEKKLQKVIDKHPMSIPRYYLSLIDASDRNDPIRKMAIPSVNELDLDGSYDTSGERKNTKLP